LKRATTTSKTKVDKVRAELESIGTVDATTKVPLEWQLSVLFQPRHARWSRSYFLSDFGPYQIICWKNTFYGCCTNFCQMWKYCL